jgi:ATP/maltotriose-dependent transcriptional regulator MalT
MVMHAEVRAEQGRLWEADESFRQAVRLLSESGFELSPAAEVVRIGMADLFYERDDVDGAERDLERGRGTGRTHRGRQHPGVGIRHPLADRAGAGDERGDLERARQAERVARDSGADLQIAIAASWMARLRLAQGDLAEARAVFIKSGPRASCSRRPRSSHGRPPR